MALSRANCALKENACTAGYVNIAIFIGISRGKASNPAGGGGAGGLGLRCRRLSSFAYLDTLYVMGRNYANKGRTIRNVMGEGEREVPETKDRETENWMKIKNI